MYKSRLQEVCHQKSWGLPKYTSTKDGPDHNPRFSASVTVNGVFFETIGFCKSSKEAQNAAAKIAFDHFNSSLTASLPDSTASQAASPLSSDMQYLYKNRLQEYAQRRNLNLPVYSCIREGQPHALRFKGMVTVDGKIFEGTKFLHTLKEAEHDAAKIALMSLSSDGIQEDESGVYKNLLQELSHKEGFSLPIYKSISSGASHLPTFISTVEIEGEVFHGKGANSKRQAEMNAAKVAYSSLKERRLSRNAEFLFPSFQAQDALDCTSSSSHLISNVDLQGNLSSNGSLLTTLSINPKENGEESKDGDRQAESAEIIPNTLKLGAHHSALDLPKHETYTKIRNKGSSSSSDVIYARLQDPFPSVPSSPDDGPSSPVVTEAPVATECDDRSKSKLPTGSGSILLCNRIRVYPRKPDTVFPKDIIVLPISDDKWVAVSLDFPNQQDN